MPISELLCVPPGEIKTSVVLDRERTGAYKLLAQATDGGGRWCRAEVKLKVTDVNDNPPIFTQSQYSTSVYEDTIPKALLTRTLAIDPDEGDAITLKALLSDFLSLKEFLTPHHSDQLTFVSRQRDPHPRFPDMTLLYGRTWSHSDVFSCRQCGRCLLH